jgi:hypothetical protein
VFIVTGARHGLMEPTVASNIPESLDALSNEPNGTCAVPEGNRLPEVSLLSKQDPGTAAAIWRGRLGGVASAA